MTSLVENSTSGSCSGVDSKPPPLIPIASIETGGKMESDSLAMHKYYSGGGIPWTHHQQQSQQQQQQQPFPTGLIRHYSGSAMRPPNEDFRLPQNAPSSAETAADSTGLMYHTAQPPPPPSSSSGVPMSFLFPPPPSVNDFNKVCDHDYIIFVSFFSVFHFCYGFLALERNDAFARTFVA